MENMVNVYFFGKKYTVPAEDVYKRQVELHHDLLVWLKVFDVVESLVCREERDACLLYTSSTSRILVSSLLSFMAYRQKATYPVTLYKKLPIPAI